jgi:hypothetical protein
VTVGWLAEVQSLPWTRELQVRLEITGYKLVENCIAERLVRSRRDAQRHLQALDISCQFFAVLYQNIVGGVGVLTNIFADRW